nr:hypothetical protein [Candidatus Sigynarchaeota archaeon]
MPIDTLSLMFLSALELAVDTSPHKWHGHRKIHGAASSRITSITSAISRLRKWHSRDSHIYNTQQRKAIASVLADHIQSGRHGSELINAGTSLILSSTMSKDPEDSLNFRLKRVQFNHRLPAQLVKLFDELGNERKYLLEYLLWLAVKHFDTGFDNLDPVDVSMLEKYMASVREILKNTPKLKNDFPAFATFEQELDRRDAEGVKRRASAHASKGSEN